MGLCRYLFFISYTNSIDSCFVVQSLGRVRLFVTPWTAARQASLSFTVSWSLLKLKSIQLVTVAAAKSLQLCPTLCDPMNCSTPGFPVLHCLLGFAHIHVH